MSSSEKPGHRETHIQAYGTIFFAPHHAWQAHMNARRGEGVEWGGGGGGGGVGGWGGVGWGGVGLGWVG
jgi:hypothetical protein